MGLGCQRQAPADLTPRITQCPLYRRLGGPQGRSGPVRKISFQPGFDLLTIHSIASRYTNYAIPTHALHSNERF